MPPPNESRRGNWLNRVERVSELLSAYVDGELTQRQRRAVLRLLRQSPEARAQLQLLEALKGTGNPRSYLDTAPGAEDMAKFYGGQGNAELSDIEKRFGGG